MLLVDAGKEVAREAPVHVPVEIVVLHDELDTEVDALAEVVPVLETCEKVNITITNTTRAKFYNSFSLIYYILERKDGFTKTASFVDGEPSRSGRPQSPF